ncbi:MAG: hypothetical protein ACI9MR_002730 [Myxococcota bacterium]|jgi:hypothetical protein
MTNWTRLRRWANSAWVVRGLVVLVGLAAFSLGSVYLSMQYPPDVPTFQMFGRAEVAVGATTAFRLNARSLGDPAPRKLEISGVRVGRDNVAFTVADGPPSTLSFEVPQLTPATETLFVDVASSGRSTTLRLPLTVSRRPKVLVRTGRPEVLVKTDRPFRLELVPEHGALTMALDNRVFARVTDPDGVPVMGAKVAVEHRLLKHKTVGQRVEVITDANGLAVFELDVEQPSFTLKGVILKGTEKVTFERLLNTAGRRIVFGPLPHFEPGQPLRLPIRAAGDDGPAYCEITQGKVWLRSARVPLGDDSVFETAALPVGRYRAQCYLHPHSPGNAWAVRTVEITEGSPIPALARTARRAGRLHPKAPITAAGDVALAEGYLQALLVDEPVAPVYLVDTSEDDQYQRTATWDAKKRNVLLALAGLLFVVLLVICERVLKHIIGTRDRFRAYATELELEAGSPGDYSQADFLAVKGRDRLVKTRGLVMLVIVGGTIVLNVVGVIFLLSIVR